MDFIEYVTTKLICRTCVYYDKETEMVIGDWGDVKERYEYLKNNNKI